MSESGATDPADPGLLEAAPQLRSRALSAAELLEACQARIATRNGGAPTFDGAPGAINAWTRLYPELAAELARAADARLATEAEAAPLTCGIPFALKDLFAVAGLGLTASSRVLEGSVAAADSAVWRRLRAHGAVLAGHTHTHEFAAGGTTDQVANPWAPDRIAGGSSGGSAAALASRMVPAAVGPDTAGSLRIPPPRLAPHPRRAVGRLLDQADLRAHPRRWLHPPEPDARPSRPDGAQRRRC